MNFRWEVVSLHTVTAPVWVNQEEGETEDRDGVVLHIQYRRVASLGDQEESIFSSCDLDLSNIQAENFVPFESITKEKMDFWLERGAGKWWTEEMDRRLSEMLGQPLTQEREVPWA